MADGVWKGVQSKVIEHSDQRLLNKFFDPSTPSMRNTEPPAKSKMADGVWKGVQSLIIGRSDQLLLNKFFDLSTPSIRKGRDGGIGNGGENNGRISGL